MSEVEQVIKNYSKVGKEEMDLDDESLLLKALEMSKQQTVEPVIEKK